MQNKTRLHSAATEKREKYIKDESAKNQRKSNCRNECQNLKLKKEDQKRLWIFSQKREDKIKTNLKTIENDKSFRNAIIKISETEKQREKERSRKMRNNFLMNNSRNKQNKQLIHSESIKIADIIDQYDKRMKQCITIEYKL